MVTEKNAKISNNYNCDSRHVKCCNKINFNKNLANDKYTISKKVTKMA